MIAIFKREMRSYFTTSTGYVFLAVALALSAIVFGASTLLIGTSDTGAYFSLMLFVLMIILPILTMKTFSEERRTKTEQLLMTAPISTTQMVMGKFLSCLCMFLIALALSCINFIPIFTYADTTTDIATDLPPNVSLIIGNLIALILVGMSFIAIGIFISSLTENQFAAVVITIAILLGLLLIGLFNSFIESYAIRTILSWLSIYSRYTNFTYGIFDIGALIYYLSISGVFIFLTIRVFESRKYR
ncbi:MAG: ABC transporter permease [Clostridia bacterium]|nr:ABC transporter permease [Clostridia bacterium]MBR2297222.1 ABC transporter permease [Clostridia bacterium]